MPFGTRTRGIPSFISLFSEPLLWKQGSRSFATGLSRYLDSEGTETVPEARIVIPVASPSPSAETSFLAVVDTAAPWCVFRPDVVLDHFEPVPDRVVLSTRLGVFHGRLYRGLITLVADQGTPLDVDATVFLAPDWPGPNFLGYQGFLQRIRFAVDPESNLFYFGRI